MQVSSISKTNFGTNFTPRFNNAIKNEISYYKNNNINPNQYEKAVNKVKEGPKEVTLDIKDVIGGTPICCYILPDGTQYPIEGVIYRGNGLEHIGLETLSYIIKHSKNIK